MSQSVTIIGLGLAPEALPSRYLKRIEAADVLIGGHRILEHFQHLPARKMEIRQNLPEVIAFIKSQFRDPAAAIVVLASGDPLFYGIGSILVRALGPEKVEILPNVSAVAAAFARLKEPWQDVRVISLHGRKIPRDLSEALLAGRTVAVYTDPVKNPAWVADFVMNMGLAERYLLWVLEKMGAPDERISTLAPAAAAAGSFADPNLVVLKPLPDTAAAPGATLSLGLPENAFEHESGLITKAEVRAVTLAKLCLDAPDLTLWDLGAGSGSVALEASLFIKTGAIIAVEQKPARLTQIEANRRKFQVPNLQAVSAALPAGMEALPIPDRVFIGGGGPRLAAIARKAADLIRPGGVMVINTVLLDNLQASLRIFRRLGFSSDVIQVQVSRGATMPFSQRFDAQNPVWIAQGRKPA